MRGTADLACSLFFTKPHFEILLLAMKSGEEDFKGDSNGSFSLDSQTMKKQ